MNNKYLRWGSTGLWRCMRPIHSHTAGYRTRASTRSTHTHTQPRLWLTVHCRMHYGPSTRCFAKMIPVIVLHKSTVFNRWGIMIDVPFFLFIKFSQMSLFHEICSNCLIKRTESFVTYVEYCFRTVLPYGRSWFTIQLHFL